MCLYNSTKSSSEYVYELESKVGRYSSRCDPHFSTQLSLARQQLTKDVRVRRPCCCPRQSLYLWNSNAHFCQEKKKKKKEAQEVAMVV